MLAELITLPADAPASLTYLIAALAVLALQAFPLTGIFLMIAGGPLWCGVLITIAMIGTIWEVATGQVGAAWLALPGFYFGAYYLAWGWERFAARRIAGHHAAFNAGKQLHFDPARQDLLLAKGRGDFPIDASALLTTYALPRVFEEGGRMHFIGTPEACTRARSEAARQSGLSCFGRGFADRKDVPDAMRQHGIIAAPGTPDRNVVRVTKESAPRWQWLVPVQLNEYTIFDEASGETFQLQSGRTRRLKAFPFPIIGFALNSGAPKWQGFAGMMRSRLARLRDGDPDERAALASALGLAPSDDLAARAVGPEAVAALIADSDKSLTDNELALLETMLSDPLASTRSTWFYHLTLRPEVVAPHADRIIAALGALQASDVRGSYTGRNLWRLLAVLPDDVLARHRARIVDWLAPETARTWTKEAGEIYARLDASVPQERAILLHRLESERGDLKTSLLPGFARLGSAAPAEVKARLLALWQSRAPDPAKKGDSRSDSDTVLYFTLARMGLKAEAGEVVQHYYGPTFAAIWREVEADSHPDLCGANANELSNHFRGLR